jgi:hypothetical protein
MHRGAASHCAVDLEFRAVALDHAVHHGEAEAGAALALGGEERLQAAPPRFIVHADAGVRDLDPDRLDVVRAGNRARAHGQSAAVGHGIDRIDLHSKPVAAVELVELLRSTRNGYILPPDPASATP